MNPWLEIPLADYEGHMALPSVAQSSFLADVLASTVRSLAPSSVAVLGCAGGNGFEALPPERIQRLVGVDINPAYLATARSRHQGRFVNLELHATDFLGNSFQFEPVELVFAGLFFEYVDLTRSLERIRQVLVPGGHLCAILQLPNLDGAMVTPSPFVSLSKLTRIMALIPPDHFLEQAVSLGFQALVSRTLTLNSGKSFHKFLLQSKP